MRIAKHKEMQINKFRVFNEEESALSAVDDAGETDFLINYDRW